MSSNIIWHESHVTKNDRVLLKKNKPVILWFSGLSGSGKSSLADALEKKLYEIKCHTYLLDGDNIRYGLNSDLGFDEDSRVENIRRIGEVSKLFVDAGLIVLTAFISPFKRERDFVRSLVKESEFIEIFVDVSLSVCEQRDVKGLYKKARTGEIGNFTGISSPYEKPINSELHIDNANENLDTNVEVILAYLREKGYIDVR